MVVQALETSAGIDRGRQPDGPVRQPGARRRGEGTVVRVGFMPLSDCAALVVASRLGFAAAEGLTLDLVRQTSWATLRDRVAVGHVDVAHMLAPQPIAASLGAGGFGVPMVVPMALGLGGNAITVSTSLWAEMADVGAVLGSGPAALGAALRTVALRPRRQPVTLAVVHPFSAHNYELRYFLAAAGLHPDRDVRLTVVPPSFMGEALVGGQIDGFCVGEPWNSLAVEDGSGVLLLAKSEIWQASPCKVLGLRADFAERAPATVSALVRATERAALWVDDPANRPHLLTILAETGVVGVDAAVIERALTGRLVSEKGGAPRHLDDFLTFHRRAATFPWKSHALWFYSQMVRWGHIAPSRRAEAIAAATYRPDLYRAALAGTGAVLPSASSKLEGALSHVAADGTAEGLLDLGPNPFFFDGRVFDPEDVPGYVAGFDLTGAFV